MLMRALGRHYNIKVNLLRQEILQEVVVICLVCRGSVRTIRLDTVSTASCSSEETGQVLI